MYRQAIQTGLAAILAVGLCMPVPADSSGPLRQRQTDIYGSRQHEPTCCYSEERIWKKTGSQTGWSIDPDSYDPYGFPRRDEYPQRRPEPLPRDVEGSNPWSVAAYDYGGESRHPGKQGTPWGNAQFYQPPAYLYPAPVGAGPGSPLSSYGPGGIDDPYPGLGALGAPGLGYPGAFYPGLGGPLGLLGPLTPLGLYGPGMGLGPGPGIW